MALQVIRTVAAWLPVAVADGSNLEARGQLLLASHLAGLGQASGTGVGLVHAIGHALGTRGRLPARDGARGGAPRGARVLRRADGLRDRELALVAVALGAASPADRPGAAARAAIERWTHSSEASASGRGSASWASPTSSIPVIARDAVDDPAIANSPRLADAATVEAILRSVA